MDSLACRFINLMVGPYKLKLAEGKLMDAVAVTRIQKSSVQYSSGAFARAIDHWIFVFMAAGFLLLTLVGFIPDSLTKIAAVEAGARHPFPLILHIHAVLMGAFLLVLLAQTTFAATGRIQYHRRLGLLAAVLVPAIVVAGFILVPTMYRYVWDAAQNAPPEARAKLHEAVLRKDNIVLLQLRMGILFPLFMIIGLRARDANPSMHKRMMILAVAMVLPPAIDRILWLPSTLPASPLTTDLYTLLAVLPMFAWDLIRTKSIKQAYVIWLSINLPFAVAVHGLWGSQWWHAVAPRLVMV
jgi:hypothetical protein